MNIYTTQNLLLYFALLGFSFLLVMFWRSAREVPLKFGAFLDGRAFKFSDNPRDDYTLYGVIRAVLGVVLLLRAINIYDLTTIAEKSSLVGTVAVLDIVLSLLLIFGFLSQYAQLILVFYIWQMGAKTLGTSTLGNDVAAILALSLIFLNAGKHFSIDGLIIKKWSRLTPFFLYGRKDLDTQSQALVKILAVFSYWCMCVYSVALHLGEIAWTTGVAGPQLLTNNFMSKHFEVFVTLFESSEAFTFLSRVSMWMMIFWYPTILPFIIAGGWLRQYAIWWGVAFFIVSWFILDLSALAPIEFLLWSLLFLPSSLLAAKGRKLFVFFDDRCNLCKNTVKTLQFLDLFEVLAFKPATQSVEELALAGLDLNTAMEDLYGFDTHTKRTYGGYRFYIEICCRVVLLMPLLPILVLGRVVLIGPWIYRNVALRRRKIFGQCEIVPASSFITSRALNLGKIGRVRLSIVVSIFFCGIAYLLLTPYPYLGKDMRTLTKRAPVMDQTLTSWARSAHWFGIAPINVFNRTDLRMAENWYTLESLEFKPGILPIFNEAGKRLDWHRSDRLYFGNTVRYRRSSIGVPGCHIDHEHYKKRRRSTMPSQLARFVTIFLERNDAPDGVYKFRYNQYYEPLADFDAIKNDNYFRQSEKTLRCSEEVNFEFARGSFATLIL